VSAALTALFMDIDQGDSAGPAMRSAVVNFRTTASAAWTASTKSVYGGWHAEGWAYGPQAEEDIQVAARAMSDQGWISQSSKQTLAGQIIQSLVAKCLGTAGTTIAYICGDGDTFAFPQPFPDTAESGGCFLTVLASQADSTDGSYATYLTTNCPAITELYDATYAVFAQNLPAPAANLNAISSLRVDIGTGHYVLGFGGNKTFGLSGSLLNCDHQTFSPGKASIWRGLDALVVDGNNVVTNENPATKSQYADTLVINSPQQTYPDCMGSWDGGLITISALDTDNSTYAGIVGNFPSAYAPASPGDGTGGPCSVLRRRHVKIAVASGKTYDVFFDLMTCSAASDYKGPRWEFVASPMVVQNSTSDYSITVAKGSSKLFGRVLGSQPLANANTTPLSGVYDAEFSDISHTTLSTITVHQSDASTVSAMDATAGITANDGSWGVQVGAFVLMPATSTSGVTYSFTSTGSVQHLVFGLTPNAVYQYSGGQASTNAEGTLKFSTPANASSSMVITQATGGAPSAPTLNAPGVSGGAVSLSWSQPSGASTYNLYRGVATGGETLYQSGLNTPSYTDSSVTAGSEYFYEVTAVGTGGESSRSNEEAVTLPPGAPTGISIVAGVAQLAVSWTASPGATGYNLYLGTSSGGESLDESNVTSPYVITGLSPANTYYLQITATNAGGESARSAEASKAPQPPAPASLTATPTTGQVALSWPSVFGATSYNVYRGTISGGEVTLTTGVTGTAYNDRGVANGTPYYYEVTAVALVEGPASPEAQATPLAQPTGVVATGQVGQITIGWSAVPGATQYQVWRGLSSDGETLYETVSGTQYVDSGVTVGRTYFYYVVAIA
jgi:fibronectin type 3 domain-containing protein